ncbi:MAG: hypothetical protein IPN68_15720 [Bacteroidetes bacterium]|nr:hypothetical protein [Bacteroidota bacterium]
MHRAWGLRAIVLVILALLHSHSSSQDISEVHISYSQGLKMNSILLADSASIILNSERPLYSFLLNKSKKNSAEAISSKSGNVYKQLYDNILQADFTVTDSSGITWKANLDFRNVSRDTLIISNLVPFGEDSSSVQITGKGPSDLARAWLFRPGYQPVRVILPDNAWEMGYSSFRCGNIYSVCSVIRRESIDQGQKRRYETVLPPGAGVQFKMYAELFTGEWQNGLRRVFRDRYIYDVEKFDNSLFMREDLAWIRESYLIVLMMAWDREFYDRFAGKYTYAELLKKYKSIFGYLDVFGIWPTWPRLGLDQRNQWDLYHDLPGGTDQLRSFVRMSQMTGTKFFIL